MLGVNGAAAARGDHRVDDELLRLAEVSVGVCCGRASAGYGDDGEDGSQGDVAGFALDDGADHAVEIGGEDVVGLQAACERSEVVGRAEFDFARR